MAAVAAKLNDSVSWTVLFDFLERVLSYVKLGNIVITVFILTTEDYYLLFVITGNYDELLATRQFFDRWVNDLPICVNATV